MSEVTGRNRKLEVAVVGGGVCGLACAVALQKVGVDVQVFEAAERFGQVGGGIGFGPNAIRALEGMGILDVIIRKLPPGDRSVKGFLFYSGLDAHELIYDYPPSPELPSIAVQRSAFLDALAGAMDPQKTTFSKRCKSIIESPTDPQRLVIQFVDGTTHEADVVLGADGIKSAVRNYVAEGSGASVVTFSRTVTYRGMVRVAPLQAAGYKTPLTNRPAAFIGPDKHIVLLPILAVGLVLVAASCTDYETQFASDSKDTTSAEESSWVGETPREDVQKEFEGWGPDVTALLSLMPEKIARWSVYVVHPPLNTFAKGNAAILGDAAHAMTPHIGAGAGQGLEDALLLVRLLNHPQTNLNNVKSVLRAYSDVRRPRAQSVWDISDKAGKIYEYRGPNGSTPEGLSEDLRGLLNPVWHHDLDDDFNTAERALQDAAVFVSQ